MTTVSVLVPSYNHADFIGAAVHSALVALDEAGVDGEIRVLDDGSSDRSLDVLGGIDDPRLDVKAQANAGAHIAFNRLLSGAQGDVIFLLNSDDLYAPGRIRDVLRRFDREPTAVAAGSWLEVIDTDGARLGVKEAWRSMPPWPRRRGAGLSDLGDPGLALLETNYLSTTSNIAFRRSAIGADHAPTLRFTDLRYCHDWDFFLQLARRGPLLLLEEPLVSYRVHPANTLKETEADGTVRMRFEILWLLARHAGA
ncbi:MAG: glycosyltransferase family 2 protein, partial [Acidobacteriota bacterium]